MAYVVVQQCVNAAQLARPGLVNGYLVSLFPLGAMLAVPSFGLGLEWLGVRQTLAGLAAVIAATAFAATLLVAHDGVVLAKPGRATTLRAASSRDGLQATFWKLFMLFFLAASAGLMVLSQAAGIITAYGGATALAVYGTTFIAATIAVARLTGGWMVDWLTIPGVAAGAHTLALAGNAVLTLWPGPAVSVVSLALVGAGYGLISGLTAAAVAVYWRRALYGRIASRIYLAWCTAAVVLPIGAGRLFDLTQGYGTAIVIAAGGNVLGILIALGLPRERATRANP